MNICSFGEELICKGNLPNSGNPSEEQSTSPNRAQNIYRYNGSFLVSTLRLNLLLKS